MSEDLIEHWQKHQAYCELGLENARRNLDRLQLQAMGQLALDLYPTIVRSRHGQIGDPGGIAREGEW